jgi:Na+/H+-dicarboxylate symporter
MTAASTMSSAAALPMSITGATKNTHNPVLANSVIPITLNFHMLGDTICIPIMALIVLRTFHMPPPTYWAFAVFGMFFVLNKFAGAGIPGGTIMVSLPVLQHYLGFSEDMLAFITTFYMLVDPITTTGNVTANNLLVIFINRFFPRSTASDDEF